MADVSAVADGALLDVMTGGTLKIEAKLDVRGTLQLNGGSLAGGGIIDLDQGNLSLLSDYSTGTGPTLDFFAQAAGNTGITTVNGPGILTNAAGQSTYFVNDQINTGLENVGDIQVSGQTAFNGTFDNTLGATLRVATDDATSSYPLGTLVIDQGFTNAGDLILDDLSLGRTGANLTVTSGVLTNMGTILSANSIEDTDNYTHALTASVDNQGSLDIDHDLTMRFGSDPAFVNSGTLDIDRNHTLWIDSADADLNAGTQIDGEGILYFLKSTAVKGPLSEILAPPLPIANFKTVVLIWAQL